MSDDAKSREDEAPTGTDASADPAGAAPDPDLWAEETPGAADDAPQPTPVVPPGSSSYASPAGTAAPHGAAGSPLDRPEVAVGAAFAGGMLAAMILRRLGR